MAKDVPNKTASNNNNTSGNTSPPSISSDQQKVPPLRIVLNTAGNQKSSSTAIAVTGNQQAEFKRDRQPQDAKSESALKTGGRVRIKLGTNKQASKSSSSSGSGGGASGAGANTTTNETTANKLASDDTHKFKGTIGEKQDSSQTKEESSVNYSHLRRITRRSQRSVQTVNNEDEESISSMTSTDENQNTTNNNNSDNNSAQDSAIAASAQPNATASTTTTNASNSSSNSEAPRRYKRRKGETSEFQLGEHDFCLQNYKLPNQNSFELYRNIRKQVDKRLRNLSSIQPKTPYGFRDYMLTRGAYLLDGNKLGNGTNLFMNEDGGLHPAPIGKYHGLKYSRVNYSVPNRAKVPLGLPVNSPLYNLFIDQEKERYRMRMQHIKEREKLTLAAEQEIVRVYNQAAMAAANQIEPFSACTMLKHQEIYNYLDSEGFTILSSEDAQRDQAKPDGGRTRRRNQEQTSPAPTRKNSSTEEFTATENQKDANTQEPLNRPSESQKGDQNLEQSKGSTKDETVKENATVDSVKLATSETEQVNSQPKEEYKRSSSTPEATDKSDEEKTETKVEAVQDAPKELPKAETSELNPPAIQNDEMDVEPAEKKGETKESEGDSKSVSESSESMAQVKAETVAPTECSENMVAVKPVEDSDKASPVVSEPHQPNEKDSTQDQIKSQKQMDVLDVSASTEIVGDNNDQVVPMEQDAEPQMQLDSESERLLSDDDRRAYNKEVFLSQLQDIDDKWEKIRGEMLIRHRNEAESLYAVQKLEWEWKTKEIGACDVRMTPIIDSTLVPRLNIYSQDY